MSTRDEVIETLRGLGYGENDANTLADHFLDAEARGKRGHGLTRVEWLDDSGRPGARMRSRSACSRSRGSSAGRVEARSAI